MKAFWILLILVILFVVGSATAMNYFGNKRLPPGKGKADDQDDGN